jgi:AcrR family transcriptional regulator
MQMKKKTGSRETILSAAVDLFHAQGVHATGLDEILRKSGTGKGQFYHYFESKDDLIHHTLRHFLELLKSGAIPVKLEIESWSDLEHWFQFFIAAQKAGGCARSCPIATIAAEVDDHQKLLRQDACEIFDWVRGSLVRFFAAMKKRGELRAGCDPDSLADFCQSIMQGGLLMAKIRRDSTPFEHSVQHALAYVKSLRV